MKCILLAAVVAVLVQVAGAAEPVTLTENGNSYQLDNGILSARLDKRSGKLESLKYNRLETLDRQGGYWSHSAAGPKVIDAVTIDPESNGGERAEVSVKG